MSIKIIYSKKHREHNPQFEIYDGVRSPYAEKAERIISIVTALQKNGLRLYDPDPFPLRHIYDVHEKLYVRFLKRRSQNLLRNEILHPSYFIMDTYTPITTKTYDAARSAVDVVLTGSTNLLKGESMVYALCRPPGHHAERHAMSGYCYFNNAAIAAHYLSAHGKIAILDVDFHHGNGTQNIFYDRCDVLYVSIHADPRFRFPYSSGFSNEKGGNDGYGYNYNFPLPLGTDDKKYLPFLNKSLDLIKNFNPKYLLVSLGFDTYIHDPIGGFKLSIPFYRVMGKEIASLKIPTLLVQEGGYNISDLGKIAISFLAGIST